MNALFADTFYFLALLNAADEMHAKAEQFPVENYSKLVTTAWVLTELADGLAQTQGRQLFRSLLDDLESDPTAESA